MTEFPRELFRYKVERYLHVENDFAIAFFSHMRCSGMCVNIFVVKLCAFASFQSHYTYLIVCRNISVVQGHCV